MINNKYLETMFSTTYFAESASVENNNEPLTFIRVDEDMDISYSDVSVIGRNNKIFIKTSDIVKFELQEDVEVTIDEIVYLLKEFKRNADGTTTITLEKQ